MLVFNKKRERHNAAHLMVDHMLCDSEVQGSHLFFV